MAKTDSPRLKDKLLKTPVLQDIVEPRLLAVVMIPAAGLFAVFIAICIRHHSFVLYPHYIQTLPILVALLLWLIAMDRERRFVLRFSPALCAISVMTFVITTGLMGSGHPNLRSIFLVIALMTGCLIRISPRDCLARAREHPSPAVITCFVAASMKAYYFTSHALWDRTCLPSRRLTLQCPLDLKRRMAVHLDKSPGY